MPAVPFSVDAVPGADNDVRLRVSGEIDIVTAPSFTEAIETPLREGRSVVVDLEDVSFIDSSGLSALVSAITAARRNEWDLSVARAMSTEVTRLIQISGLGALLDSVAADDV